MTYNYRQGVTIRKKRNPLLVILPLFGMVAGLYLLMNTFAPALPSNMTGEVEVVAKKLTQTKPELKSDRLYVPKIGVDVAIVTGVSESTLEGGAWHRLPENGDPANGGNFVLAAHRFNLGLTPNQTRAKSPFYHINKLVEGDDIYADYNGVRYAYKVTTRYKVDQTEVSIESRTDKPRLTMYSCDLRGPKNGREVVEAKPVGIIAWSNGQPKLRPQ